MVCPLGEDVVFLGTYQIENEKWQLGVEILWAKKNLRKEKNENLEENRPESEPTP